jgi:hypothetical protein|tara:strand:+ start:818 stop:1114 length:297 start_codon:yes stop_codon:yes gene_type:complete
MDKDWLQLALGKFNVGKHQWYGWRKDWTGEKRMSYENIILNDDTATMPTKNEVETKMEQLQTDFDNAETKLATDKASAKQKLKDLGLTDDEIKAITKG